MTDLYRVLPEEMDKLVTELGQPRYRADQLLRTLYHESPRDISELHQLPAAMRDALVTAGYTIGSASEVHRIRQTVKNCGCRADPPTYGTGSGSPFGIVRAYFAGSRSSTPF